MHSGKTLQFPQSLFFGFLRQVFLFDLFSVFVGFHRVFVGFTKFLFNRFELLPEVVFTLAFVDIVLDLGLDFIPQFKNIHLVVHHSCQFFEPLLHIDSVQDLLLFLYRCVDDRSNKIGQGARFRNGFGHGAELRRKKRREL